MASMNGTDLDGHSFCCFELVSTASLVALVEAEGSVSNNGPSGSGNLLGLKVTLKHSKHICTAKIMESRECKKAFKIFTIKHYTIMQFIR